MFHALGHHKPHDRTRTVRPRIPQTKRHDGGVVPSLGDSTPQRIQMGRALSTERPRRARGPFAGAVATTPSKQPRNGRADSGNPARTSVVGRAENPGAAPRRRAAGEAAGGVDERGNPAPRRAHPAGQEAASHAAPPRAVGACRGAVCESGDGGAESVEHWVVEVGDRGGADPAGDAERERTPGAISSDVEVTQGRTAGGDQAGTTAGV